MATIKNECDLLLQGISPRFVSLSETGLTQDQLTNITNMTLLTVDNVLSAAEKVTFKVWWDSVVAEYIVLNDQAALYGLDSILRTNYTNAYNTLSALVSPWLSNMAIDSVVDGATFTTDIYAYYEDRQALIAARTNYYIANPNGGRGVNIFNPRYCTFEETSLPPVFTSNGTASLDTGIGFFGSKSLKFVVSGANSSCFLGSSSTDYNFNIQPNKKWIFSTILRSSLSNKDVQLHIRASDGAYAITTVKTPVTINTWTRVYGVIDLSSNSSTKAIVRIDVQDDLTSGTIWVDGLMLEEKIGDVTTPSAYSEPPNFLKTYLGDLDATKGATWGSDIGSQPADDALLNTYLKNNSNLVPALINWTRTGTVWHRAVEPYALDNTSLVFPVSASLQTAYIALGNLSGFTTYTLSFRAMNDSGANQAIVSDLYPDTLPQTGFTLLPGEHQYTTTWTSSHADMSNATLRFLNNTITNQIRISDVKLEVGGLRTPWSRYKGDIVSKNNHITPTNYSEFLDEDAITNALFVQNTGSSGHGEGDWVNTFGSFDADGKKVAIIISGALISEYYSSTPSGVSYMNAIVQRGATTLYSRTVVSVPNPMGYPIQIPFADMIFVPAGSVNPENYSLTLYFHDSSGKNLNGFVSRPSMLLLGLRS